MLMPLLCCNLLVHEFAISVQDSVIFVSLNDKHLIKVDLSHYQGAAAERSRHVLVGATETFEVGDHDFMKFPVSQLWSRHLRLLRAHGIKVRSICRIQGCSLSTFICSSSYYWSPFDSNYRDWQQKHYLSVTRWRAGSSSDLLLCSTLSCCSPFELNLDCLVVERTHSWRNPVER